MILHHLLLRGYMAMDDGVGLWIVAFKLHVSSLANAQSPLKRVDKIMRHIIENQHQQVLNGLSEPI